MSDNLVLKLLLTAADKMSAPIRGAVKMSNEQFEKMQKRIKGVSDTLANVGKKALIGGAAIGAMCAAGVTMAAGFEAGMSNVSTLIDTNTESMQVMGQKTLDIFKRVPISLDDTTGALYNVRSAGIAASDSMNVLERSAKLGVAGLGSTSEAVDLVTSSINAFNLKGKEQNRIYDIIFKAVKTGKTNISQLAQGFGAVAGTVAAAGIKVDEYIASVAAITTVGNPASQAHTQIKAAIAGLTRGTKDQQKIFKQLHSKDFNDLIQKSGGMVGAFQKINTAVHGNKSALISLLGSIEAYNAFLGLTGGQNKAYVNTLNDMRYGANAVDEAFEKQSNTITAQTQRFKNLSQSVSISFGQSLMPVFSRFLDAATSVIDRVDKLPPHVKTAMSMTALSLAGGLTAFGGLSIASSVALKGYGDFLSIARKVSKFTEGSNFAKDFKFTISGKELVSGLNGIINGFKGFKSSVTENTAVMILSAKTGIAGMVTGFKNLPGNIIRSSQQLLSFIKTQMIMMPLTLSKGYEALGGALTKQVHPIKSLRTAMIGFNIACSANPIGLVVLAIAGAAFLIYKYWKPIAGFFRGLWAGVVYATKPLHPMFEKIGQAVKPIVDWFKKLVSPVNSAGKGAEMFGFKIGKAIGDGIMWVAKLIKKVEKLNKIFNPTQWGKNEEQIDKKLTGARPPNGTHALGLSYVPFDGYNAILHEGERILTKEENKAFSGTNIRNSGSLSVTFAPVIHADAQTDVRAIKKMLEEQERKLLEKLKTEQRRREARAYA